MLEKDMVAAVRLKFQNILACLSPKLTKFSKISLLLKSRRSWHILEAEKGNKVKSVARMLCNPGKSQPRENPVTVDIMKNSHTPILSPNQCGSSLVQIINAPLPLVWSMVRQFDNPQAYKRFVKDCNMLVSNGGIGSVREVMVVSGLPAETSVERLDRLDDDLNVMMVSIIGGDHKLVNYRSTTTLHETKEEDGCKTVVIESYVVDIPGDSCGEDTCLFADTIISCNLKSLAMVTEKMASDQL